MKKWIVVAVVVLALTSLACSGVTIRLPGGNNQEDGGVRVEGSGQLRTETRSVSDFDRIEFDGIGRLRVSQGDTESLTVEAEDNILPRIRTEVSGGTLRISIDKGISLNLERGITYTLVVKDLRELQLNGLGDINVAGLTTDSLSVRINGAGKMEINDLQAESLEVILNGLGSFEVEGEVERQEVRIEASGNYDGEDLRSTSAVVSVDGLGGAQVWVTGDLDASISGAGSIEYYGSPNVKQQVNGLGRVRKIGDK